MVSTVERQLTYPEDSPKDNDTCAEDSSAEDDIDIEDCSGFDTEGGGGEGGFNTEGGGGRVVSIRWAVMERTVVEPENEAICFYAGICSQ